MAISYVLKCDGCGARDQEQEPQGAWFLPADWIIFNSIKRAGYSETDAAFCPDCWKDKTCEEAFAFVNWRRT